MYLRLLHTTAVTNKKTSYRHPQQRQWRVKAHSHCHQTNTRCSTPFNSVCSGSTRSYSSRQSRAARNAYDIKVGGHQASSASMVSILTALYFHYLEAGDRVSIKPHAFSYHAIQYLLGNLDQNYLQTLALLEVYKRIRAARKTLTQSILAQALSAWVQLPPPLPQSLIATHGFSLCHLEPFHCSDWRCGA